jgi:hypothetical protein
VALLLLPFFGQLLGFGNGILGGGLCGELFTDRNIPLNLQGSGFWYSLLFMGLLATLLLYGAFVGVLGLLRDEEGEVLNRRLERGVLALGVALGSILVALFIFSRTTGLPTPSPQGMIWGEPSTFNPLAVVLALMVGGATLLLGQMRRQVRLS